MAPRPGLDKDFSLAHAFERASLNLATIERDLDRAARACGLVAVHPPMFIRRRLSHLSAGVAGCDKIDWRDLRGLGKL
jgi:predicted secreted Zn-dependent protease